MTDEAVARLHLEAAQAALAAAGLASGSVVAAGGEATKSFTGFEHVCEALIAAKVERGDLVVALGGGVVGDVAGFAAAAVRRGLDYIQVPTTLLAQVDSSVGGKTAINSRHGKNLVGAFHQPVLVVADTSVLDSLPPRQFRAGYAEVVKYGLLGDAGFFDWLDANVKEVFAGGAARDHAIATSCRMKAAIVARDERENGDRALLNFGHTFGHALEAAAGFSDRLLHGEAIAIGMVARGGVFRPARRALRGSRRNGTPPHRGGRPAGDACRDRGRTARPRHAHGTDGAGQEGQARQADIDPSARHRPCLYGARCRSGAAARLPCREARGAMTLADWLIFLSVLVFLFAVVLLFRERDRADGLLARHHAAARQERQFGCGESSPDCWKTVNACSAPC